jgi:hypothetical protein
MTSHRPRHVVLCLDNSISIGSIFNEWIKALSVLGRSLAASTAPIQYSVALWSEGSSSQLLKRRILGDELAAFLPTLTYGQLTCGMGTNVSQALNHAATAIGGTNTVPDEDVLVVIMSDGKLNAWREAYSWDGLVRHMKPPPTVVGLFPGSARYGRRYPNQQVHDPDSGKTIFDKTLPEVNALGPYSNVIWWDTDNIGYLVLAMATTIGEWLDPSLDNPNKCVELTKRLLQSEGIRYKDPDSLPDLWKLVSV